MPIKPGMLPANRHIRQVHSFTTGATMRDILAELGPTPKIAILRGGGTGDFLAITPALRALKKNVPGAHITLITSPWLVELARRYPSIDKVVTAPYYHGVHDGPEDKDVIDEFFAEMQKEKFTLAIQLHGGGPNSNPFVLRLGAEFTAGFKGDDAAELDFWLPYDLRQHEVMRCLDLLTLLGGKPDGWHTELPLLASDFEELEEFRGLVDFDQLEKGRYLGVHVGAGAACRRWAPDRFARVADALLDEFDFYGIVATAGADETSYSSDFVRHLTHKERAADLGGKTSRGAQFALLSKLGFLLTNDTGPAHVAQAIGTPCVVIFGAAHPINWAPLNRAWYRAVANWTAPCRWFVKDGCPDSPEIFCLQTVQAQEVLAEARKVLIMRERLRGRGEAFAP